MALSIGQTQELVSRRLQRGAKLEIVTEDERTAADIDKQLENHSVKGEVFVQTNDTQASGRQSKPMPKEQDRRQTIRFTENAQWIGRALQLRKLVKQLSADEVRKDPEGLALLQVLFSSEEIKDRQMARLAPRRIDAKTPLVRRHGDQTNTNQEAEGPSANCPWPVKVDEKQSGPHPQTPTRLQGQWRDDSSDPEFWQDEWKEEPLKGECLRRAP